jgi:hypothetical protein
VQRLEGRTTFYGANSPYGTAALPTRTNGFRTIKIELQIAISPGKTDRLYQQYISTVPYSGVGQYNTWNVLWESLPPA